MTATTTGTPATKGWTEGWGLFWTLTFALAAMSLGFLFVLGWGTDGYRMVIRATARTSLVLFLAAFALCLLGLFLDDGKPWK